MNGSVSLFEIRRCQIHAIYRSLEQFVKGLVIDEPWISLILEGRKSWEMRSTSVQFRGRIALIRKGSGQIVGVADLVDVIGPLDAIARRAHRDKHCIPKELDESSSRWNVAWVLEYATPLIAPVAYHHPLGAVIWVNLDDAVAASLRPATGGAGSAPRSRAIPAAQPKNDLRGIKSIRTEPAELLSEPKGGMDLLPFAKDGTWFGPHLARAGKYTVGAKGDEELHPTFAEALTALKRMSTARWRRPNSNGNWGIVSAVRWARPERDDH